MSEREVRVTVIGAGMSGVGAAILRAEAHQRFSAKIQSRLADTV